jgi:hypothetical protein
MGSMTQPTLFGSADDDPPPKPAGDRSVSLRLLVTVKAAPNPSEKYGETVCVAGLSLDLDRPGWIRLYPINFRYLDDTLTFKKYDVVRVDALPARTDQRRESWRPIMPGLTVERHLKPWAPRRQWIDSQIVDSMCELKADVKVRSDARSLALVRPREVSDLHIVRHPGWTDQEQAKIDKYVQQLDLLDERDRTPLAAPRFKAWYRYRCHDRACRGHRQVLLDWEFVVLQRRLVHLADDEACAALRLRFLTEMCAPDRDVAFYVGNQAKRTNVFSVLGVYYPKKSL